MGIDDQDAFLGSVLQVLAARSEDIAVVLSDVLSGLLPNAAVTILADDRVAVPHPGSGTPSLIGAIPLGELIGVRDRLEPASCARGRLFIDGAIHGTWAARADSGELLLAVDPAAASEADDLALALWRIAAQLLHRAAREASPRFLHLSRTAMAIRTQAIDELTDLHLASLESILSALRSRRLSDRGARDAAIRLAADAVVQLHTATDRLRTFDEEPVTQAFQRLRDDLRPLTRHRDIDVQLVEPPVDGRPLPPEIAHGARAVVRGAVLALIEQPTARRVRVQWDCDGANLLIDMRDDGPGTLTADDALLQPLQQRVVAMHGRISIEPTPGWGTELSVVIPLDPPIAHGSAHALPSLSDRESEVLDLMVQGWRNDAIAETLGISVNTVKFHTSNVFRALGVSSRAEAIAAAVAAEHGSSLS
ncbi:LuxR C-terminal-related transcriptional regulator [Microbacterium marinilacus]|nr:LuxR C-terminal-related transcriptional regulator [Microbacterium marinilacus]